MFHQSRGKCYRDAKCHPCHRVKAVPAQFLRMEWRCETRSFGGSESFLKTNLAEAGTVPPLFPRSTWYPYVLKR